MKQYWQLLAVFALALLGAIAWQVLSDDPGYVLLQFRGWALETTLIVAALLVAATLILLWLAWRLLRLPFRLWRRRRRAIARERLASGLLAVCEGRWQRAEKLLSRAASEPSQRQAAWLMAAQVALVRRDGAAVERYLERARADGAEAAAAVIEARRLLEAGRPGSACELLEAVGRETRLPPSAVELQARAMLECGRAADALALLPGLADSKLYEGEARQAFEQQVAAAALQQARSSGELGQLWSQLSRGLKQQAAVVLAYARRASALDHHEAATQAIEAFLGKQYWDEALAALYGRIPHAQPRKAIKRAEHWLDEHPGSPGCLLALGELCRREQLWGKAEQFLQRALDGEAAQAWEALGRLYSDRGDHSRARQALHNALAAQRGEATAPLRNLIPAERELAALEHRTSMGLPQLPASD